MHQMVEGIASDESAELKRLRCENGAAAGVGDTDLPHPSGSTLTCPTG